MGPGDDRQWNGHLRHGNKGEIATPAAERNVGNLCKTTWWKASHWLTFGARKNSLKQAGE